MFTLCSLCRACKPGTIRGTSASLICLAVRCCAPSCCFNLSTSPDPSPQDRKNGSEFTTAGTSTLCATLHSMDTSTRNRHSCSSSFQRTPSRESEPVPEHQPRYASDPCCGAPRPPPPCAPTVAHGVSDTATIASASAAQQRLLHNQP